MFELFDKEIDHNFASRYPQISSFFARSDDGSLCACCPLLTAEMQNTLPVACVNGVVSENQGILAFANPTYESCQKCTFLISKRREQTPTTHPRFKLWFN